MAALATPTLNPHYSVKAAGRRRVAWKPLNKSSGVFRQRSKVEASVAGLTLSETRNQLEDDLLQSVVQPGTQEDEQVRNRLSADLHSAATVSAPPVQVLISDQPITRQQLSQARRPGPEDLLKFKPGEFTRSQSSRAPLGCVGTGARHHGCSADKCAAAA